MTVPEDDDAPDVPIEDTADPVVCRACGSPDIVSRPRALWFAIISMAGISLGVAGEATEVAFLAIIAAGLFLMMAGRWHCNECGESWN